MLRTAPRRSTATVGVMPRRHAGRGGRNVLFVSHCDFTSNSAYHVYAIASELERRGWSPAIAVPRNPRSVRDLGRPGFPVVSFREARRAKGGFANGRGPDLVHAFTPREPVRNLTLDLVRRHGCPYVVHLEDNESAVRSSIRSPYDATAMSAFLDRAAGVTVVIDRLRALAPDHVSCAVVWPGYDEAVENGRSRRAIRRDVGLEDTDFAVVYTGSVHEANADEVRSLYEAVGRLRGAGSDLVLVRSGWNGVPASRLPRLGRGVRDLGWIKRRHVLELQHAADALVQPGSPGPFNDYRFPSKLPEFLASGRPVVLPRTNIGLQLQDRVEALLVERGDADELGERIAELAADPGLRERLGQRGREFARRELRWAKSVDRVADLYDEILHEPRRSSDARSPT